MDLVPNSDIHKTYRSSDFRKYRLTLSGKKRIILSSDQKNRTEPKMTKADKAKLAAIDRMLDHWAANPTPDIKAAPISDPAPHWDHIAYLKMIRNNGWDK